MPPAAARGLAICVAFFVLFTVYVDSTFVPMRCRCPNPKNIPKRIQAADFEVIKKGAHCIYNEIVVTTKHLTNGQRQQVCLSPDGQQGKRLLKCWNRMQKTGGDKKKCLRNQKRQKRNRPKHSTS